MGTRSTTKIYEKWVGDEKSTRASPKLILALYKQFDGYVEGWGNELVEFIESGTFVNGISLGADKKVTQFNGIGDFALLLVKKFKEDSGGLYATTGDDSQEYNYILRYLTDGKTATLKIECEEDKSFKKVWKYDLNKR